MQNVLHEEHELLGGCFDETHDTGLLGPRSYHAPSSSADPFDQGAALCDLSGCLALMFSGEAATSFAETALSGRKLGVGECALEASLLGDGALASMPLCARSAEAEYLVWDFSPRSDTLDAWLSFLSRVDQGGVKPFEGLACTDLGDEFVSLLLAGPKAAEVLTDYLGEGQALPSDGGVANLVLDGRIPAIALHHQVGDLDCQLLLVAPRHARVIWRSLLSFSEVSPVGYLDLFDRASRELAPLGLLASTDRIVVEGSVLRSSGLTRRGWDFVGTRGLVG